MTKNVIFLTLFVQSVLFKLSTWIVCPCKFRSKSLRKTVLLSFNWKYSNPCKWFFSGLLLTDNIKITIRKVCPRKFNQDHGIQQFTVWIYSSLVLNKFTVSRSLSIGVNEIVLLFIFIIWSCFIELVWKLYTNYK